MDAARGYQGTRDHWRPLGRASLIFQRNCFKIQLFWLSKIKLVNSSRCVIPQRGSIAVLSVPQPRKLRELKEELARARALESHVQDRKDQKRRDLKALRDDPAYLELVARDRLDLYREGEQIYRIDAEKVPQAIELRPSP